MSVYTHGLGWLNLRWVGRLRVLRVREGLRRRSVVVGVLRRLGHVRARLLHQGQLRVLQVSKRLFEVLRNKWHLVVLLLYVLLL